MLVSSNMLNALRAGDPAALAALFNAHADKLYRLALGLLGDPVEAEDVVQETFVKLITHSEQFEGRARPETWLYRVAYNASLDRLRRKRADPLPDAEAGSDGEGPPMPQSFVDWSTTPEAVLLNAEAGAALVTAIQQLPESLRAVFLLRDVEGFSTEEAAEALGLSIAAAKVRLHRARLALREQLAGYFGQSGVAP